MKTIKELIDFVRENPKFFPDQFYQQARGRNIMFGKSNSMVICSTGEITVNCETKLSAEEIKSKIFSTFQKTTISKMQQHLETLYLAALEPSLDKIKNNPKSHFVEDEDILTTKGSALGIDITNNKAIFLPDISPEQKITALTEFFEKIVLEKRRLNAEKVFETRDHSESEKAEAEALEARKTKVQTKYKNPEKEEKNKNLPKDNQDLRISILEKHLAQKRAINTQHTASV